MAFSHLFHSINIFSSPTRSNSEKYVHFNNFVYIIINFPEKWNHLIKLQNEGQNEAHTHTHEKKKYNLLWFGKETF